MFVAASTHCFAELPLANALKRLVDLEYTAVEIGLHESGGHLKPSEIHADLERAVRICRETRRLTPVAYSIDIEAPEELYYEQFASCCRLAKATKVVNLVVRSAELGTPFNAEVERLRAMVDIASRDAIVIGLLTETDRMAEDPDTATVLCNSVKGLGLTLDPSYFIYPSREGKSYEQILKYVSHVRLRDTSKDDLQVRIGKGLVEYGRLVTQLSTHGYNRALCVDMVELPDVDHHAEMRKMRLLLESLL